MHGIAADSAVDAATGTTTGLLDEATEFLVLLVAGAATFRQHLVGYKHR